MREHLIAVHDRTAFRHTPVYAELELYHVEFDQLTDTRNVESQLRHWMTRQGHVALIARSGAGKSSTLAGVFGALADVPPDIAPLRIPIALAGDDVATQVGPFARHVVRQVSHSAQELTPVEREEIERLTANSAQQPGWRRDRSFSLGCNLHAVHASLARDITETALTLTYDLDAGEATRALLQLIQAFRAHDVEPLLVFDDTDSWANRADANVVAQFFDQNVRMITNELDCGVVVAVHERYLRVPEYAAIANRIEPVRLPRLPYPVEAITQILQKRLEVMGLNFGVDDVMEEVAMQELAAVYDATVDIRRVIGVAALAIRKTLDDPDLQRVPSRAVQLAAAERESHGNSG